MRVLEVHRGQLLLHDGEQHLRARARAALVTELSAVADMLAVGDWVIAARDDFGQWWVHARLQPSTQVARRQHDDRDKVRSSRTTSTLAKRCPSTTSSAPHADD